MHNQKSNSIFRDEIILCLGIIAVFALAMLALNNYVSSPIVIAKTKSAKVSEILQDWGKVVSKENETGLGVNAVIFDEETLENSLKKYFDENGAKNFVVSKLPFEKKKAGINFSLLNGVEICAQYLLNDTTFCTETTPCAEITTRIEANSPKEKTEVEEEYLLFSDGIKKTDSLFEGWEKKKVYPVEVLGTTKYYFCNSILCEDGCNIKNIASCSLAPIECQTGKCTKLYAKTLAYEKCSQFWQTGHIEKLQVGTVFNKNSTKTIDKCCYAPRVFKEFDIYNNKVCGCPSPSGMEPTAGHIYNAEVESCETACPKGTYVEDADVGRICKPCKAGYYCPTIATSKNSQTICPKGYFCPTVGDKNDERYCNISYRVDDEGTILPGGLLDKTICKAGYYCPKEGLTEPKLCPKGAYCPKEGMAKPINCPAGTYSDKIGAETNTCIPCPTGTYADTEGSTRCSHCFLGTFTQQLPKGAKVGAVACTGCAPGSYFDTEIAGCKLCPAGTFQSKGSQLRCEPCYEGTYSDKSGTINCTPCPKGYSTPALEVDATVGATRCIQK